MPSTVESPGRPIGLNYIGGGWQPAVTGETYEKHSPMRPSSVVATLPASTEEDVAAAAAAAAAAQPGWAALPLAARAAYLDAAAAVLDARAEEIAADMTAEMGKPVREARAEARRAAQILRFAGGEAFRAVGEIFEQSGSARPCRRGGGRSASSG